MSHPGTTWYSTTSVATQQQQRLPWRNMTLCLWRSAWMKVSNCSRSSTRTTVQAVIHPRSRFVKAAVLRTQTCLAGEEKGGLTAGRSSHPADYNPPLPHPALLHAAALVLFMLQYGLRLQDIVYLPSKVRTGKYKPSDLMPPELNDYILSVNQQDLLLWQHTNSLLAPAAAPAALRSRCSRRCATQLPGAASSSGSTVQRL